MMIAARILIVVALQTLALAYMIYDRQMMLNSSRVVTLKVAPVDPRDIFRGDYVVLNYEISRLNLSQLGGEDKFDYRDTVYVTLVPDGTVWKAAAIARNKPLPIEGGVPIRGEVSSLEFGQPGQPAIRPDAAVGQTPTEQSLQTVSVLYGIESYFVPEGTGRKIEEERQKGDLSIDVAIDREGRAAIKAMRRNGKTFYVEGVF
jgi:uncharacterized membrane-anchored protein